MNSQSVINESILLSLFGPPGCGKGTCINHVIRPFCDQYGIPLEVFPISGNIQKILDAKPSDTAHQVRQLQRGGYLVPDEIANEALKVSVSQASQNIRIPTIFVTDGSPRRTGQIEEALVSTPSALQIKKGRSLVLRFTTHPSLCGYRAAHRKLEEDRQDDEENSFQVRWSEFLTHSLPAMLMIENNAKNIGVDVREIDGANMRNSPHLYQRLIFGHLLV